MKLVDTLDWAPDSVTNAQSKKDQDFVCVPAWVKKGLRDYKHGLTFKSSPRLDQLFHTAASRASRSICLETYDEPKQFKCTLSPARQ